VQAAELHAVACLENAARQPSWRDRTVASGAGILFRRRVEMAGEAQELLFFRGRREEHEAAYLNRPFSRNSGRRHRVAGADGLDAAYPGRWHVHRMPARLASAQAATGTEGVTARALWRADITSWA
jgi:hypothetical protein